ncbi:MAG: hypothetical protein V9G20_31400 [Candidatus Promineifilaceae bacterium]
MWMKDGLVVSDGKEKVAAAPVITIPQVNGYGVGLVPAMQPA